MTLISLCFATGPLSLRNSSLIRTVECIPVGCLVPVSCAKRVCAPVLSAPVVCGLLLWKPVPLETPQPTHLEGRELLHLLSDLPFYCPSLEEARPAQMFVERTNTQTTVRFKVFSYLRADEKLEFCGSERFFQKLCPARQKQNCD